MKIKEPISLSLTTTSNTTMVNVSPAVAKLLVKSADDGKPNSELSESSPYFFRNEVSGSSCVGD